MSKITYNFTHPATVAHEGNPRTNSLVVSGTLDGDVYVAFQYDPLIPGPSIPPPIQEPSDNSDCPDCEVFTFSERDAAAIALCESADGDGVVTGPGDCALMGSPDCENTCEDYYGDFRFGRNTESEGNQTSIPWYWESTPYWITPAGYIICNSSCGPGIYSDRIVFDTVFFESQGENPPVSIGQTPATALSTLEANATTNAGTDGKQVYEDAVCDVDPSHSTGPPSGQLNNGESLLVKAFYVEEAGLPIAGLAILTSDGTGATIKGYGILIDRDEETAKVVSWNNVTPQLYTVLSSGSYNPTAEDPVSLRLSLKCGCATELPDDVVPTVGDISATCGFGSGPGEQFDTTVASSMTRGLWEDMTHAAVICIRNTENGLCENTMTFRTVYYKFERTSETDCP